MNLDEQRNFIDELQRMFIDLDHKFAADSKYEGEYGVIADKLNHVFNTIRNYKHVKAEYDAGRLKQVIE